MVSVAALARGAAAESRTALRSYWSEDHRHILSEVMVVRDDGSLDLEHVVGGSIDGIGMIQFELGIPFLPTRASSGARLRWPTSCVFITPDSAGTRDIAGDGEVAALAAAMESWNQALAGCGGFLRLMLDPSEPLEVGFDGKNVLKFREDRWCRPVTCKKPPECYSPSASAITTLCYVNNASRSDDGAILDVDIEVNAVNYAIATGCETQCVSLGAGTSLADLQNTLTHELGHLLGLDHTCWSDDPSKAPRDDQGHLVPQCNPRSALPPEVTEATMYNFQDEAEVKKRSLEADDLAGACSAYPAEDDPKLCEPIDVTPAGGCCAVAGRARREPPWLLGAALLLAVAWGRRRRRC